MLASVTLLNKVIDMGPHSFLPENGADPVQWFVVPLVSSGMDFLDDFVSERRVFSQVDPVLKEKYSILVHPWPKCPSASPSWYRWTRRMRWGWFWTSSLMGSNHMGWGCEIVAISPFPSHLDRAISYHVILPLFIFNRKTIAHWFCKPALLGYRSDSLLLQMF